MKRARGETANDQHFFLVFLANTGSSEVEKQRKELYRVLIEDFVLFMYKSRGIENL